MSIGLATYYDVYAATDSAEISADALLLGQAGGFNDGAITVYMQLWEGAPGGVLIKSFRVPAGSSFSWEPSFGGRLLGALQWAQSSTPDTFTGTTEDVYVYAEYTTQAP